MNGAMRIEERNKNYQRGIDVKEMKRKREEEAIQLRRRKRDELMVQKRAMGADRAVKRTEDRDYDSNLFLFPADMIKGALQDNDFRLGSVDLTAFQRFTLLIHLIVSEDNLTVLAEAVRVLRQLLSGNNPPPLQMFKEIGIITKLIKLLNSKILESQLDVS